MFSLSIGHAVEWSKLVLNILRLEKAGDKQPPDVVAIRESGIRIRIVSQGPSC